MRIFAFDLDDTLYPEREFVEGGLVAAGQYLDASLPQPIDAASVFLSVLRKDGPFRVFDVALEILGIQRTKELIASLVAAYRNHPPSIRLFAPVKQLLFELKDNGAILVLISDGPTEVQYRKVECLGISTLFDHIVLCRDVGGQFMPKPSSGAFIEVERRTGAYGQEILYVGDWPAMDFPAPDLLGWRTVRARYVGGYHNEDPDIRPGRREVSSPEELRQTLLALL